MNSGKTKIFNQSFLEIALINFLVLMTFYSLIVAVGPYAVDVLHLSTASSGLLVGIVVIGSLVMYDVRCGASTLFNQDDDDGRCLCIDS